MDECESVPGGQSRPFPTRFCDKNFHKIDLGTKSNFWEKSGWYYHNQDYGPNGRQNIYAWSLVFLHPSLNLWQLNVFKFSQPEEKIGLIW